MLHVYRQINALRRVRPLVIARKREHAELFPFDDLTVVPKPPTQFLRRIWYRQLRDVPWMISRAETSALLRVLASEQARVLHIYFGHIAVHLLPLIRAWSGPSVVSFHGADVGVDLQKSAYRAATKSMLDAVRLVLVRSESLRDALVDLGCAPDKIRVQRTGIPLHEFAFQPRTWPATGEWRLLQAGRLVAKKGFTTTLGAFAAFAQQYPRAMLTIAGDGPLREELQQTACALRLADRVAFGGFVSQAQLREMLYDSHLFLHPSETAADSNQEGVPNAMLEAMATGLPVFATTHGGIPEAIESGRTGVLVAERDSDALARELLEWTAKPEELSELARRGSESVALKFEQTAQVAALEDYYFEAMSAPAA
jgi:glycosyltransferase involved in cell wall biosynthesis